MQNYWISRGTLLNICRELNNEVIHWNKQNTKTRRQIIQSNWINESIREYARLMKYPFSARDVSSYLNQKYRVRIPPGLVRNILKNNLEMSYKLGKSRPVNYCESKASLMKGLFSLKISRIMNRFDVLINIDEAMFSRSTKASYSWSKKGKESTLMNIWFSNSTSLITAITSNGDVFAVDTNGSITSKILIKFIDELEIFLMEKAKISISSWLIILDNASTHRSNIMKKYINEKNLKIAYIPAYSPELAPVEKYFSMLKRIVIKKTTGMQINWKTTNPDSFWKTQCFEFV